MHLVTAVVLAAGLSSRFPGNKLLYEVRVCGRSKPLIRHTVEKFSALFDDTVVVVGHEAWEVINALKDLPVKFVYNNNYTVGMSESVKVGVRAVMKYSSAAAIHPGDVTFILPRTLMELLAKARELINEGVSFVLIPRYRPIGKGGHPLIIHRDLLMDALNINERGMGLKEFLNRNRDRVIYYDTDDVGVIADIDTLDDIKRNYRLLERECGKANPV